MVVQPLSNFSPVAHYVHRVLIVGYYARSVYKICRRTQNHCCCGNVRVSSAARHRPIGLVVKTSASRAEDLEFDSHLRWDFSRSCHTSDLKLSTPVATLPGAWRYRVSAGTGRPVVSIV